MRSDPNIPHFTALLTYLVHRDGRKFKKQADGTLKEVKTITTYCSEVELIEVHKDFNIVEANGTIMVHNPTADTLFIVCMDDSKSSGKRTFDERFNTVEEARSHIDWLLERN